jgi:hypothetical protein
MLDRYNNLQEVNIEANVAPWKLATTSMLEAIDFIENTATIRNDDYGSVWRIVGPQQRVMTNPMARDGFERDVLPGTVLLADEGDGVQIRGYVDDQGQLIATNPTALTQDSRANQLIIERQRRLKAWKEAQAAKAEKGVKLPPPPLTPMTVAERQQLERRLLQQQTQDMVRRDLARWYAEQIKKPRRMSGSMEDEESPYTKDYYRRLSRVLSAVDAGQSPEELLGLRFRSERPEGGRHRAPKVKSGERSTARHRTPSQSRLRGLIAVTAATTRL